MGTWVAAQSGSLKSSSAIASDPATSRPMVMPFREIVSPSASASSTPSTTARLRRTALEIEDRTDTRTVTMAVSGARSGLATSVTRLAIAHASPAARPAFRTMPTSVEVGRVHETDSVNRVHHRLSRPRGSSGEAVTTTRMMLAVVGWGGPKPAPGHYEVRVATTSRYSEGTAKARPVPRSAPSASAVSWLRNEARPSSSSAAHTFTIGP